MLMRNAATDRGTADLMGAMQGSASIRASLEQVSARISKFEERYGFDSDEMRQRVGTGSLREDDSICTWLMLLSRRDRLVQRQG